MEEGAKAWLDVGAHWRGGTSFGLRPARTLRDVAMIAGLRDFVSLIIARGVENGLLEERRLREAGRIAIEYCPSVGG